MTSLIRDVLLPSAAALGLLMAAAIDTAGAEEPAAPKPALIAAASISSVPQQQRAAPPQERASVASPDDADSRPSGIERRCERTGRIGKFHITRCD